MENLLKHHIEETSRRFTELREDLKDVRNTVKDGFESVDLKIEQLDAFRTEVLASARTISVVWGGGCAIIGALLTIALKKFIG